MYYLKGLQREYELGDFYGAKEHYIDALTKTVFVNHRIRKQTLERVMDINRRIGFPGDSPEKCLLSRYYIKQKTVQVVLDVQSFPNTKILKSMMTLPKMLYQGLESKDQFGLKILKNGWVSNQGMVQVLNSNKNQFQAQKLASSLYLQDVIVLEEKWMNETIKNKYFNGFTEEL